MKVLFVCHYNSARSQMAAAFFNHYAKEGDSADSAGIEPGMLSMHAVKAMAEKDIDLFGAPVKGVDEVCDQPFTHLVVIGDETMLARCPEFKGLQETIIWDLPDPSKFEGPQEELTALLHALRDEIETKVTSLLNR